MMRRTSFFGVLEGLIGLHSSFSFSFFGLSGWYIELDYCDIEWFAWERKRDHSVIFVIASKYCISASFGIPAHSSRYNGSELNSLIRVHFSSDS